MAIWCAFDMEEYRGKKVPRMWRNFELDSVMGLYHINSRRESNLGELMAPIIRSLQRPSATSVLSSRSGSSNILERITTTELPPLKNHKLNNNINKIEPECFITKVWVKECSLQQGGTHRQTERQTIFGLSVLISQKEHTTDQKALHFILNRWKKVKTKC